MQAARTIVPARRDRNRSPTGGHVAVIGRRYPRRAWTNAIITTDGLTKSFGKVRAVKGRGPGGGGGHGLRAARAERRGEDHHDPHPHHPPRARRGHGHGGGVRRRAGRGPAAAGDRPRGAVRGGRREPHRPREPRDGGAPVPPPAGRGPAARGRCAGAVRARRRGPPDGEDLLGRHAAPARRRREPRRPPEGAVHGRADHRAGPEEPAGPLGADPRPPEGGHHPAALHAVPRGSRQPLRSHRGDRPRDRDRRGDVGGAEGQDRRRGPGAARRGRAPFPRDRHAPRARRG